MRKQFRVSTTFRRKFPLYVCTKSQMVRHYSIDNTHAFWRERCSSRSTRLRLTSLSFDFAPSAVRRQNAAVHSRNTFYSYFSDISVTNNGSAIVSSLTLDDYLLRAYKRSRITKYRVQVDHAPTGMKVSRRACVMLTDVTLTSEVRISRAG